MKVEVSGEVEAEKVTLGNWELKRVGICGNEDDVVYSLKNDLIEIRFIPGYDWFNLKWMDNHTYCYTGGDKLSKGAAHLFGLYEEEA